MPGIKQKDVYKRQAQCFHPLAAVRHIFGQARDVGGFFGPKGMSVHLRGKPISHSTPVSYTHLLGGSGKLYWPWLSIGRQSCT